MKNISGATAIVTGGARRLGKHIGLMLGAEGVNVIVHYRTSKHAAEETADQIRSAGVKVWVIQADLAAKDGVADFTAQCAAQTGSVDILINSASIFPEGSIFADDEAYIENLKVNTLAPLALCRWFADQDAPKAGSGSIINLLDTRILDYDRKHVPYHLSKQALFSLTRMLSIELAPEIRVNGVAPGLILPPEGKNGEYLREYAHTNPLNTWGSESDITDALLYLIKAPFVTGQIIYVDGGRHIKGRFYGS